MNDAETLIRLNRDNSSHEKAIVFIHGIGTRDPQEYWQWFTDVLLADTHQLVKDFDVFVWGYPTHRGPSWLENLLQFLRNRTPIDASPAIERLGGLWRTTYDEQFQEYQDMVLVCHSMGGLVIQSWIADVLEDGESAKLDMLRHITFYATPHNGAPIARVAWNDQLEGMTVTSSFVARIRKRWYNRIVKWKNSQMRLEDRSFNRYIPHLVLVGVNDKVVPYNSAAIMDMPCKEVPGNHKTLIWPTDPDDTRYKSWRNELERVLNNDASIPVSSIKTTFSPRSIQEPRTQDNTLSGSKRKKKGVSPDPKKVFVIYGRNDAARREMFAFLQALGLSSVEWSEVLEITGKGAPYINDILEAAFSVAQAVIVLLTGDDEARLKSEYRTSDSLDYEEILMPQARPNVLFEAGIAFGRQPDRTILVEWGKLRPSFSDISGRHIVRLSNGPEKRMTLALKLQDAGCQVDLTDIKWIFSGNFDI